MPDGPYDDDFVRWTQKQARLLRESARAGTNLPLDWKNLAEEVEDLGRSSRRDLHTRLEVLVEHLLKLQYSSAARPRSGWIETVGNQRNAIQKLLRKNRSLRRQVAPLAKEAAPRATERAARALRDYGESIGEAHPAVSADRLLSDWIPGAAEE